MTHHTRYAIYFTLGPGPLAEAGAGWLGWDIAAGEARDQDEALARITETPRKYGFHGTLKPPMRLAPGTTVDGLRNAASAMARAHKPFAVSLQINPIGRFLALTPATPSLDLRTLAAACVTELDEFRAPATEAELAKRRQRRLTAEQEANLVAWGYPYVHGAFQFHMTLTGRLDDAERETAARRAEQHFAEALSQPVAIDAITLCGERKDGRFEVVERMPLGA